MFFMHIAALNCFTNTYNLVYQAIGSSPTAAVAKRIFTSSLVWTAAGTAALISLAASHVISLPFGLALTALFLLYVYWNRSRLINEVMLAQVRYQNWAAPQNYPWYSLVLENLYLGAIPLADQGHLQELVDLGVDTVVTALETDELNQTYLFGQPVSKVQWQERGVAQCFVDVPDRLPPTAAQLHEAIEFLHQRISTGHKAYVQCRGGKGRSASIVLGYLVKYHNMTFEAAEQLIRSVRPQISPNATQKEGVREYLRLYPLSEKQ